MKISRGDIYYIKQDARCGNEIKKDRPGVVVSANHLNAGESCVEVVFLTSQPKMERNEHVIVRSSGRESTALCEQISSISVQRLGNYAGKVTNAEMEQIEKALLESLDLNKEPEPIDTKMAAVVFERDTYKRMYEELLDRVVR